MLKEIDMIKESGDWLYILNANLLENALNATLGFRVSWSLASAEGSFLQQPPNCVTTSPKQTKDCCGHLQDRAQALL